MNNLDVLWKILALLAVSYDRGGVSLGRSSRASLREGVISLLPRAAIKADSILWEGVSDWQVIEEAERRNGNSEQLLLFERSEINLSSIPDQWLISEMLYHLSQQYVSQDPLDLDSYSWYERSLASSAYFLHPLPYSELEVSSQVEVLRELRNREWEVLGRKIQLESRAAGW